MLMKKTANGRKLLLLFMRVGKVICCRIICHTITNHGYGEVLCIR
ncbi:hypothetical protein Gorai_006363 [Gossypium raimondii]|uniref:Uncharacterized protein n=1 Tax=Gossypium raimondii TaxID=29730 RepID=A0A7J8QF20_GOSRA|nr:hypothetical protein [Gossypium raimondii]